MSEFENARVLSQIEFTVSAYLNVSVAVAAFVVQ
jgi:hypothetical protein